MYIVSTGGGRLRLCDDCLGPPLHENQSLDQAGVDQGHRIILEPGLAPTFNQVHIHCTYRDSDRVGLTLCCINLCGSHKTRKHNACNTRNWDKPWDGQTRHWDGPGMDRFYTGIDRLYIGMDRLYTGMDRLYTGTGILDTGMDKLDTGTSRLDTGMDTGAGRLDAGMDRLDT